MCTGPLFPEVSGTDVCWQVSWLTARVVITTGPYVLGKSLPTLLQGSDFLLSAYSLWHGSQLRVQLRHCSFAQTQLDGLLRQGRTGFSFNPFDREPATYVKERRKVEQPYG